MVTAVEATFDGTNFIMDEQLDLTVGQRVVIMMMNDRRDMKKSQKKKDIDLDQYIGRGRKMFSTTSEIDDYVRGLRDGFIGCETTF